MTRILFLITVLLLSTTLSFGSANRILDAQQIRNGAGTLSLPSSTDTLVGRASTDTFTNKSMSGATNTFTLIPVGAIGNGSVLSGSNTGDVTAAAFGSTPNANGFTLTGQAFNLQPADATHPGGLLAADWVTFNGKQAAGNYITALTGDVTAAGPGSSAATLATVNSDVGSFTNANITVNAKGLITAASNGTASTPNLVGSEGTPDELTSASIFFDYDDVYLTYDWITGDSGPVTISANPRIQAGNDVGQVLVLIGSSDTNTVTIADGNGVSLNGTWVGGLKSVLNLVWSGSAWVETSRR